jgi:hypothetical protein
MHYNSRYWECRVIDWCPLLLDIYVEHITCQAMGRTAATLFVLLGIELILVIHQLPLYENIMLLFFFNGRWMGRLL